MHHGIVAIPPLIVDKTGQLIVPTIATPLQNHIRQHLPYLKGVPIIQDEKFEIKLLIGADNYWKIVQDDIIRGAGPTAVESKLGYLLSSPLPHGEPPSPTSMFHISTLPTENEEFNGLWNAPSTDVLKTLKNIYDQSVMENV